MRLLPLLPLFLLAGCATTPVSGVTPATSEQVSACRYIDDITSASGRYGVFAASGLESARHAVAEQARERGATHIVWLPPVVTYGNTAATAKAYAC